MNLQDDKRPHNSHASLKHCFSMGRRVSVATSVCLLNAGHLKRHMLDAGSQRREAFAKSVITLTNKVVNSSPFCTHSATTLTQQLVGNMTGGNVLASHWLQHHHHLYHHDTIISIIIMFEHSSQLECLIYRQEWRQADESQQCQRR